MKAVVITALGEPLEVRRLDDPTPGRGEVVVSVARCGICGSDVHMTHDPAFDARPGDVLGHEFAGEVVDAFGDVEGLAKGDLVSVIPFRSCGECRYCRAGETAWCPARELQGGGYAEFAAVHARQCVKLPITASLADGALVEPLAVALHAIRLSGVTAGDRVLILGAGPIGLSVAFWARRFGAGQVVVQDVVDTHADRAAVLGATGYIHGGPPIETAGRAFATPPDIVFECVGRTGLLAQAIAQVRIRGKVVLLGLCTRPDVLVPFDIVAKEVAIISSAFFLRNEFEAALDMLMSGSVTPRMLVSDTIGLAAVPDVMESLKGRHRQCKVLIDPSAAEAA